MGFTQTIGGQIPGSCGRKAFAAGYEGINELEGGLFIPQGTGQKSQIPHFPQTEGALLHLALERYL